MIPDDHELCRSCISTGGFLAVAGHLVDACRVMRDELDNLEQALLRGDQSMIDDVRERYAVIAGRHPDRTERPARLCALYDSVVLAAQQKARKADA